MDMDEVKKYLRNKEDKTRVDNEDPNRFYELKVIHEVYEHVFGEEMFNKGYSAAYFRKQIKMLNQDWIGWVGTDG